MRVWEENLVSGLSDHQPRGIAAFLSSLVELNWARATSSFETNMFMFDESSVREEVKSEESTSLSPSSSPPQFDWLTPASIFHWPS